MCEAQLSVTTFADSSSNYNPNAVVVPVIAESENAEAAPMMN